MCHVKIWVQIFIYVKSAIFYNVLCETLGAALPIYSVYGLFSVSHTNLGKDFQVYNIIFSQIQGSKSVYIYIYTHT